MRRYWCLLLLLCSGVSVVYGQEAELYYRVKIEVGKDGMRQLAAARLAVDHGGV